MPAERFEEEEEGEEPFASVASAPRARSVATPVPGALPPVPVMVGTHFHALDEKGRVIIPAKMRPALTAQFWMMLDENDNIGIYNFDTGYDILEHCERMVAEHPEDEDIAAAVERITGASELVEAEAGFRIPVPEFLRFCAGLKKDVVTVGVLNHAVMWSRDKWEESQERRLHSPEIRKAQASMLRAAASGLKRRGGVEDVREPNEAAQETILERSAERGERDGAGGGRGERAGAGGRKVASAGDGDRSPGVLTLSQLGR